MKVRDFMSTPVTTLTTTDTLAFAEQLMRAERVRHVPVVDGDELVGLLSHRDVLAASISILNNPSDEEDYGKKQKVQVSEVMRGDVETIGPDEDIADAADRMLAQKIGCLPVVDERRRLLGIVTEADFVALTRALLVGERPRPRHDYSFTPEELPPSPFPPSPHARGEGERAGRRTEQPEKRRATPAPSGAAKKGTR